MRIKIAVIDDGINAGLYKIGFIERDIEIMPELQVKYRTGYDMHKPSHGTTCAAIIKKYTPYAQLSSIKILNDNAKGIRGQLVKALEWCVENNMHLVNMSLGTIDFRDADIIKKAVDTAAEKGIIIVAAANNRNVYTYPASFKNVIGVNCDITGNLKEGEFVWNPFAPDNIEITSCAIHELTMYTGETKTTGPCNSFAAPMITAVVCKIMDEKGLITLDEIKVELKKCVLNKKAMVYDISEGKTDSLIIDAPIILLFDAVPGDAADMALKLEACFKNDGYNAVAIQTGKSQRQAVKMIKDYYEHGKQTYLEGIKKVFALYNPDIFILTADEREEINLLEKSIEIDIKVLMELNGGNGLEQNEKGSPCKSIKIFLSADKYLPAGNKRYFNCCGDKMVKELYEHIIKLFENDCEIMDSCQGVE